MGVYSSSFVVSPQSSSAVCAYSQPSKANWITAHAIATELSIAEVERLWLRFQQLGADPDGVLSPEILSTPALTSDSFRKNILKYFKTQDGKITFETFLRALKWCEVQDLNIKTKGIFQMLNKGSPIPRDMFQNILSGVYPKEKKEELKRLTDVFFQIVDKRGKGQIEEGDFVQTVMGLPRETVMHILNFHILPEHMRENVHRSLPEFRSQVGNTPGYTSRNFTAEPRSQVPSDPMLREIADRIYRRDWDLLANKLGFLSDDVDNYRQMYPSSPIQQVFQMLKDWKSREGRQARSDILERALREAGMTDASLLLSP